MSKSIKGLEQTFIKLDKLANIDMEPIVNKALDIVRSEAKVLAPTNKYFGGGELRDSIFKEIVTVNNTVLGRVVTNKEYAMYVEFGTGKLAKGTYPYSVEGLSLTYTDKDSWIYFNEQADTFFTTKGYKARPFMYPALENNLKNINKLTKEEIKKAIEKAVR